MMSPRLGADRKHDAMTKAVVAAAIVVAQHQAALHQIVVQIVVKRLLQRRPAVRRIAQGKARGDFAGQPAFFQVGNRLGRAFERLLVKARRLAHALQQAGALARRLLLLRRGRRLRHGHAHRAGQLVHCVDKAQPGVLHHKADGVAVARSQSSGKTVCWGFRERRAFFFVERAAGHVVLAGFFSGT